MLPKPDLMRALMRQDKAECKCPGRKVQMYYTHDGVPKGEKPSGRCERCGGRVQIVCVDFVSEWREFAR